MHLRPNLMHYNSVSATASHSPPTPTMTASAFTTAPVRSCSRDPIGYVGNRWNNYEYVNGRPLDFNDASGLQAVPPPPILQLIDCYESARSEYDEHFRDIEDEYQESQSEIGVEYTKCTEKCPFPVNPCCYENCDAKYEEDMEEAEEWLEHQQNMEFRRFWNRVRVCQLRFFPPGVLGWPILPNNTPTVPPSQFPVFPPAPRPIA